MRGQGLPLIIPEDEMIRLHSIAYAAAIQTGAKGHSLDCLTAELFTALAKQASLQVIEVQTPPSLRLIEQ
jgi:hypothetical protein